MIGKVLYTVPETVELTGIGMTKLYELMNAGDLESVRVGKRRYIPAEALQAFIDRLRGRGTAA